MIDRWLNQGLACRCVSCPKHTPIEAICTLMNVLSQDVVQCLLDTAVFLAMCASRCMLHTGDERTSILIIILSMPSTSWTGCMPFLCRSTAATVWRQIAPCSLQAWGSCQSCQWRFTYTSICFRSDMQACMPSKDNIIPQQVHSSIYLAQQQGDSYQILCPATHVWSAACTCSHNSFHARLNLLYSLALAATSL